MKNIKKIISNLLILATLVLTFSCTKDNYMNISSNNSQDEGTGTITSKSLELSPFNEIEIANYCDVEIVTGTTNKVEYSDFDNIIQYLKFEVINNRLVLKTVPENITIKNTKAKAKIFVAGSLTGLFISGSGDMSILNSFENISICDVSGSGNLVANSDSTSKSLASTVSGSGDIDILKISSQDASCTISGSGDISVTAANTLDAKISGSGNVSYSGNATVTKTISGSGELIKL